MSRGSQAHANQQALQPQQTASLAEVDISAQLGARRRRMPNYEQEDRACAALATEMAENPGNVLQKLVEVAVDLCQAHTAGISLIDGDVFRWEAVAGVLASSRGGTMPRNHSPCGICIDRDSVQLMHLADRCFPALLSTPRLVEALLIPFHCHGIPIGTVWIASHDAHRKFDKEDERVVRTLSRFAAAGWQLWKACEAADAASARKDDALMTLDRRVTERTAELSASNSALGRAFAERAVLEKARTEWITMLMAAQEEEKRRIARELHDEMGQYVISLTLNLERLEATTSIPQTTVMRDLQSLVSELDEAVRRLARDLRPPVLDDLGMATALREHVEAWSLQTGIPADFCSLNYDEPLSTNIEIAIYRVVQEALTNVARHARARNASVVLERRPDSVVVIIEDDGCGLGPDTGSQAEGPRHFGLVGIRERAVLLGGVATIESSAAAGTSVFLKLPLASLHATDG